MYIATKFAQEDAEVIEINLLKNLPIKKSNIFHRKVTLPVIFDM